MASGSRIHAIERATNMTWEQWLQYMDSIDARTLTHHQIASALLGKLDGHIDNIGWWAQAIAVTYEQHTGRRIPGQRPDGTFQTSVSKATTLDMTELMDRWTSFAKSHGSVTENIASPARVSGTDRRMTWRAKARDGSSIVVISEPKKGGRATLVVQCIGLQTSELNAEARANWSLIVDAFMSSL